MCSEGWSKGALPSPLYGIAHGRVNAMGYVVVGAEVCGAVVVCVGECACANLVSLKQKTRNMSFYSRLWEIVKRLAMRIFWRIGVPDTSTLTPIASTPKNDSMSRTTPITQLFCGISPIAMLSVR
jgi:hypothetical protein